MILLLIPRLENIDVFAAHGAENNSASKLNELKAFGESCYE